MTISYETGAVFRVVDDASGPLQRIAAELRELNAIVDTTKASLRTLTEGAFAGFGPRAQGAIRSLGELGKAAEGASGKIGGIGEAGAAGLRELGVSTDQMAGLFKGLTTSAEGAAATITSAFEKAAEAATAAFGGLDAKIAEAANAARALGAQAWASGGGGGGRRNIRGGGGGTGGGAGAGAGAGAGGHWNHMGIGTPGGGHFSIGGGPALAAGAALGFGVYSEAEFEDQAAPMFLTGQIETPAGMTKDARFKQIRDTMQRISSTTGFSPKDAGDAMLTVERQFGGLPLEKRIQIEETLAPYAGAEARLKETGLKESFEALVGLSHMTGTYDPAKLPGLARQFSFASLITPATITQLQTALSYSMPMLHAGLDMDPSSIMFMTAMAQTAGIKSTKSGTWIRSFFENAEPQIGTTDHVKRHNDALRKMGLIDAHDKPVWRRDGADGKVDWDKSILSLSSLIGKFEKATPVDERLGILKQAFGERGGSFASLMSLDEFVKQFPVLQQKMHNFKGGDEALDYLAKNSPIQQARQTWADLQNVLMNLGQVVLPGVSAGFKAIDAGLRTLLDIENKFSATKAPIGIGVLGAGAYGATRLFGIGGGAATGGAAGGAAGGVAAGAAGGAAAGAAGGAFGAGLLRRLGILGAVIGLTEMLDPKGNFGGVTAPVDDWFKKHLGFDPSNFDPSNVHLPSFAGGPDVGSSQPSAAVQPWYRDFQNRDNDARYTKMENGRAGALSGLPQPKVALSPASPEELAKQFPIRQARPPQAGPQNAPAAALLPASPDELAKQFPIRQARPPQAGPQNAPAAALLPASPDELAKQFPIRQARPPQAGPQNAPAAALLPASPDELAKQFPIRQARPPQAGPQNAPAAALLPASPDELAKQFPIRQARPPQAGPQNAPADLGSIVLPAVSSGLKGLDAVLRGIIETLNKVPGLKEAAGYGLLGAGARDISKLFGFGGPAAPGGASGNEPGRGADAAKSALSAIDPEGKFSDAATKIDKWLGSRLGFDLDKIPLPSRPGGGAQAAVARPAAAAQPWYRDLQLRDAYARQSASHPLIGGERDMEAARARALSNLPAPKVTISLLNNVKVMIGAREVAATIEAEIVRRYEHSTVAPASDTHASYVDPDYGFATG